MVLKFKKKSKKGQDGLPIRATFELGFNRLYQSYANDPRKLKLLELDGISPDKIDVGAMSHKYFTKNLASMSVDVNANSNEELSANNYQSEITKGILKLEGYYLLWRYSKKRFGITRANELLRAIWDGDVYFHDAGGQNIQIPYCFAFSTTPIMLEGRPYGQLHSVAPKRSDSFVAQVTETVMDMSQDFCGAIAPSDFLVNLSYYLEKEGVDPNKEKDRDYIINLWQKFVHVMNNKFRMSGQSLRYNTPILVDGKWVEIGDFVEKNGINNILGGNRKTLSFNIETGETSYQRIYGVTTHLRKEKLVRVTLATGQQIEVTENHSLFTMKEDGTFVVAAPAENPKNILIPVNFATDNDLYLNGVKVTPKDMYDLGRRLGIAFALPSIQVVMDKLPYELCTNKMAMELVAGFIKESSGECKKHVVSVRDCKKESIVDDIRFILQANGIIAYKTEDEQNNSFGLIIPGITKFLEDSSNGFRTCAEKNSAVPIAVKSIEYIEPDNDKDKFVYDISVSYNENFIAGDGIMAHNSPFTNISIFDRQNLKTIFEHSVYPDGSKVNVEYVMEIQKICAEWFSKGDPSTGLPYRFPVITANMSVDEGGKVVDEDFTNFVAKTNIEKGVYNIYVNSGSKIAMCMSGGTEIIYKDSNDVISKSTINNIVANINQGRNENKYKVLCNGKFIPIIKAIKTSPVEGKIMNITLKNGSSINVTLNHPSMIIDDNGNLIQKESRYLKEGDLIPVAKNGYSGADLGDFDLGWLVGMYTAEGNIEGGDKTVKFSLNMKETDFASRIKKTLANKFGERVNINVVEESNSMTIRCTSRAVVELMKRFVGGTTSKTKHLKSKLYSMSSEFRKGFILGAIDGDGHIEKSGKISIHTSNGDLMRDLNTVCRSLGVNTSYYCSRNTTGDKKKYAHVCSFMRVLPDWINNYYSIENGGCSYTYKEFDNYYGVAIKSIVIKDYNEYVYDFEVDSPNHLFQLANGVITHNCCRFINNMERMSYRSDSFGNGGLNIGSHRVVTINLARLGIKAGKQEEVKKYFFDKLQYLAEICKDLLLVHREEILGRRIKSGFLKFFNPLGWINIKMLFSTIGINGIYEMCKFTGLPIETEQGQDFVKEVLTTIERHALDFSEQTGYSFNTEEIPGESTAITFANKDKLMFGEEQQPFALYSNQYLPVIADVDIIDRINLSGKFMSIVSGGGIVHLNIAEKIDNPEKMRKLIEMTVKAGVPHFAVNYGFGSCEDGHISVCGNSKKCPICGKEVNDWYTRVIGYFTKVSSWGDVRKNYEFPRRKFK